LRIDYAEVADADTLLPLDHLGPGTRAVALVAARVGTTRLIDCLPMTE
jgi:pantothenate synthetase